MRDLISGLDRGKPVMKAIASRSYTEAATVLGSGYEAGFDAGYAKGYGDGLDENAGDPRVERIEAGFKALHDATNGEYSIEDMIVLDALQAGRDFAVRLARREQHIQQLISERDMAHGQSDK